MWLDCSHVIKVLRGHWGKTLFNLHLSCFIHTQYIPKPTKAGCVTNNSSDFHSVKECMNSPLSLPQYTLIERVVLTGYCFLNEIAVLYKIEMGWCLFLY